MTRKEAIKRYFEILNAQPGADKFLSELGQPTADALTVKLTRVYARTDELRVRQQSNGDKIAPGRKPRSGF